VRSSQATPADAVDDSPLAGTLAVLHVGLADHVAGQWDQKDRNMQGAACGL